MADDRRSRRSAGFLLIEVAVALAIVGMAFGYGFRSLSVAVERLGRDQRSSEALLLAQSTLDRVGYDIALGQGDVAGNSGNGFTWLVQSSPYASGPPPEKVLVSGYVVVVTVTWKEQATSRQVQLSTVRLAYRASS